VLWCGTLLNLSGIPGLLCRLSPSQPSQRWMLFKMTKVATKDYAYRSTWKHKFSRARNLAQRGGLTKKEMMKQYGRFPKKNEWWGQGNSYKEWKEIWVKANPPAKKN
jgi:hypothetical protein